MQRAARAALFAILFAAGAGPTHATSYVLMSLVGHELTFVTAGAVTGSRLDANRYERVTVEDRAFDRAALRALDDVMRMHRPDAKVTMLAGTDRAWAGTARLGLNPGSKEFDALVEGIASISERAGYDRLVLMLPVQGDLLLAAPDGSNRGSGRAAGLGVYVDRLQTMRRDGIGALRGFPGGFLGLFANFRIAIVDVRKRTVLAEAIATAGIAVSAERSPDADPANALNAAEKVRGLEVLLKSETERLLPALLARVGP